MFAALVSSSILRDKSNKGILLPVISSMLKFIKNFSEPFLSHVYQNVVQMNSVLCIYLYYNFSFHNLASVDNDSSVSFAISMK